MLVSVVRGIPHELLVELHIGTTFLESDLVMY